MEEGIGVDFAVGGGVDDVWVGGVNTVDVGSSLDNGTWGPRATRAEVACSELRVCLGKGNTVAIARRPAFKNLAVNEVDGGAAGKVICDDFAACGALGACGGGREEGKGGDFGKRC